MHRFPLVAGAALAAACSPSIDPASTPAEVATYAAPQNQAWGPPPALSSVAPPAPPAPQGDTAIFRTLDLALTAVVKPLRLSPLAADGDWGHASPGGAYTVVGFDGQNGVTGKTFFYPGARPVPLNDIEGRAVAFSPDGRFLLVPSGWHATRLSAGSPWRNAHPTIAVLSVPDLRVVQQLDGVDPEWMGSAAIGFRRGAQAYRLDLTNGGSVVAVGIPQPSFGCRYEDFGPDKPCKTGRSSNLRAMDPTQTGWLVDEECMLESDGKTYKTTCTPTESFRLLELSTGKAKTLAAVNAPLDHVWSYVSPMRTRACFWTEESSISSLSCLTLPNGKTEKIIPPGPDRGTLVWLDEQRIFIERDSLPAIVDLGAHTWTTVTGLAPKSYGGVPLGNGHRIVFASPSTQIVDLDARTITAGPPGTIEPISIPGTDRRVVFHQRVRTSRDALEPFFLADL